MPRRSVDGWTRKEMVQVKWTYDSYCCSFRVCRKRIKPKSKMMCVSELDDRVVVEECQDGLLKVEDTLNSDV